MLLYLAYRIHAEQPPIPDAWLPKTEATLFTGDDIMAGQHLFQKYGLMQFGTIFGHGAYLGPDFTAQYLHQAADAMVEFHRGQGRADAEAQRLRAARTASRTATTRSPTSFDLHASQAYAFEQLAEFYRATSASCRSRPGCSGRPSPDAGRSDRLTAYFAWAAWVAAAARPGHRLLLHQQLAARAAGRQPPDRRGLPLERAQPDRAAGRHGADLVRRRALRPAGLAPGR